MAYINQEKKKIINAALKVALIEFPTVKYSLSIRDHSELICTIKQGPEFLASNNRAGTVVNHYWIDENFTPEAAVILKKIKECLYLGNHDNSDSQSDYFDVGWYVNIKIGTYEKPYVTV